MIKVILYVIFIIVIEKSLENYIDNDCYIKKKKSRRSDGKELIKYVT